MSQPHNNTKMKGGAATFFQIFRVKNAFGGKLKVFFFAFILPCLLFEPSAACSSTNGYRCAMMIFVR